MHRCIFLLLLILCLFFCTCCIAPVALVATFALHHASQAVPSVALRQSTSPQMNPQLVGSNHILCWGAHNFDGGLSRRRCCVTERFQLSVVQLKSLGYKIPRWLKSILSCFFLRLARHSSIIWHVKTPKFLFSSHKLQGFLEFTDIVVVFYDDQQVSDRNGMFMFTSQKS